MKRILTVIVITAAIASLIVAATRWQRGTAIVSALAAERVDLGVQRDSTQARHYKAALRYRAFWESSQTIPDSVRRHANDAIAQQDKIHRKTVIELERQRDELSRKIRKLESREADAKAARRRSTVPFAAAGGGLLVAGLVVVVTGRARRVAP